ncbi:MAG: ABC transporter ATP-binding protein [bacterium]|nr:ABC transporter ATP-binding protein [bacterium]
MQDNQLLSVKNLKTYFYSREGVLKALNGVSFSVNPGEVLGIAGESGCGKSITALSILRILPKHAQIVDGEILFHSHYNGVRIIDLAKQDPLGSEIRAIRGKEIAMVFQEPMTSFSPVHTIGNQIMEVIRLHRKSSKADAREQAIAMLRKVKMPKPEQQLDAYPFHLSGGMRQRAMIAMALSCNPKLLIADEPTTALDATIQAQIIDLLIQLQQELKMSVILITHDLGIIAELAKKILIMYLGENIEYGAVNNIFINPKHPYTRGLLAAIPKLGKKSKSKLAVISGTVPSLYERPSGCPFHPRCPNYIGTICKEQKPNETVIALNHSVWCHLYQ